MIITGSLVGLPKKLCSHRLGLFGPFPSLTLGLRKTLQDGETIAVSSYQRHVFVIACNMITRKPFPEFYRKGRALPHRHLQKGKSTLNNVVSGRNSHPCTP